jgi:uridine kinase
VAIAMNERRLGDVAILSQGTILSALPLEDVGLLLQSLTVTESPRGAELVPPAGAEAGQGGEGALAFVLDGEVRCEGGGLPRQIHAGECFGEVDFARGDGRRERAVASSEVRIAWLGQAAFAALGRARPDIAAHLFRALAARLAEKLAEAASARVAARALTPKQLAPERLAPERLAPERLADVRGAMVVAMRAGHRVLSLAAPLPEHLEVAPITTETGEGREVFRRSASLALLEAARRVGVSGLALGASISSGRIVALARGEDRARLAGLLSQALAELVAADVPLVEELWEVERAVAHFAERGAAGTVALLSSWSQPGVELLRCGDTLALGPGPLLPRSGLLAGVALHAHPQGLLLDFGPRVRSALAPRPYSTVLLEARAPRYGAAMTQRHDDWLERMGVSSVGAFNQVCISGGIKELIFVSEGFHEKHIARIADTIRERAGTRIVAVAGPSASGKTTFIRRLTVQLAVNGLRTLGLSLDDYYLDHAKIPRDASGSQDFEVIDALDREKLGDQVRRLLAGERVETPRYDFKSGRPLASGHEQQLAPDQVLLVEGIHALNPQLLPAEADECTFRIFVHPAMSLPFDALSRLEPSDVRLLRRIVRDRHQRGFTTEDTLARWASVRRGERLSIFPFQGNADCVFDTSLIYEPSVLRVYAERYLLEVARSHVEHPGAQRLRRLLDCFVPIHPDSVPPTSILREFIGGSGFTY